jgi:hypothetical protein
MVWVTYADSLVVDPIWKIVIVVHVSPPSTVLAAKFEDPIIIATLLLPKEIQYISSIVLAFDWIQVEPPSTDLPIIPPVPTIIMTTPSYELTP